MANVKFSALPAASSIAGADIFAVGQGGVSKQISAQGMANVSLQTAAQNPAATTSTTGVMMGLGGGASPAVITPVSSGKIFIAITGSLKHNTVGGTAVAKSVLWHW